MQTPTLTRRRLGIGIGTTVALGAAGLALGTETAGAEATVAMGDLAIPETELGAEDGTVHAPHAIISGEYQWRNLETKPSEWRVYLLVTPPNQDNWRAISTTKGDASQKDASGSFNIRGPITASGDFEPADFSVADDGSPQTVTVRIGLLLMVRDGSGNTLVDAQVSKDVPITVKQTGVSASLGAGGEIQAQDDQSDPTPTASGA